MKTFYKLVVATVLIASSLGAHVNAQEPVTVPPELVAGDTYRLIFITNSETVATSGDINDYNDFVSNVAASTPGLADLGTSWKALASTQSVNVIVNTGLSGFSGRFYNTRGEHIATATTGSSYSGALFTGVYGSHSATIVSETGGNQTVYYAWTGTGYNGQTYRPLGGSSPVLGRSNVTNNPWIYDGYRSNTIKPTHGGLYAVSGLLTVPVTGPDADDDGVFDDLDNCPNLENPLQSDNDSDGSGDVCDLDDDNDFVNDTSDNCPLEANTTQDDSDYDGLGDACDANFNNGSLVSAADIAINLAVEAITDANPPGGNGMIAKLTGNGGVIKTVANAVSAFNGGLIDNATYLSELQSALDKLSAFDNQVAAKISGNKPKIVDPEATVITNASADIRTIIGNLKIAAGA
tara:strand:+ start:12198 stop:13418 length:1221 start_codon:yes stop_codon:yes gene_type:complete